LRKQRRLLLKKMRDLGDRETQNTFELEMDEILAEEPLFEPLSEIFLFLNPSQVFLGFLHRIPATPLHSG
jgi:hypothetical protein